MKTTILSTGTRHRLLNAHRKRQQAIVCSKGFGTPKPPPKDGTAKGKAKPRAKQGLPGVDAGSSNAVQQAVQLVERKNKAAPIDPKEAKKGKVDYVKVADWGTNGSTDLGELRLADQQDVTPADDAAQQNMTFYEELARRLELLKANGALSVAQPPGTSGPPPFEKWSFERQRYVQYLMDHMAVHIAMEDAIDSCAESATGTVQLSSSYRTVQSALALFDSSSGLERSYEIASDINAIAIAERGEPVEMFPMQQADAYADFLVNLGQRFSSVVEEATEAAGPPTKEDVEECTRAGLRLLAHIYALHVTHLTTGMRIGAAAVERVDLLPIKATNFYQTYPSTVADPLRRFRSLVDEAGRKLDEQQKEDVMAELPKAFQKTSLLLTSLAHE